MLAAILAVDVAGYSRQMGVDEEGTDERLKRVLREVVDPKLKEYRGRVVKNTGDGMLVAFNSVVDAVRCAVELPARGDRLQCRNTPRKAHPLPNWGQPWRRNGRTRGYLRRRR